MLTYTTPTSKNKTLYFYPCITILKNCKSEEMACKGWFLRCTLILLITITAITYKAVKLNYMESISCHNTPLVINNLGGNCWVAFSSETNAIMHRALVAN